MTGGYTYSLSPREVRRSISIPLLDNEIAPRCRCSAIDVLYSHSIMSLLIPTSLAQALEHLKTNRSARILAGGTDLQVSINEGHIPLGSSGDVLIALSRVPELTSWLVDENTRIVTLGAAVTWAEIEKDPLASILPALAQAARTVGSPQIRNAATIGGNLATCSPAGDGLPVLAALNATIELRSATSRRTIDVLDFMVGVKRTALQEGELITAIHIPMLEGWQGYAKVGVRNAMVIASSSVCVATDLPRRSVRIALGSVGPTILRCPEAESFAESAVDWAAMSLSCLDAQTFGELAAAASRPITDHRSTADYRRHAIAVLARRLLMRAFPDTTSSLEVPS